MSSVIASVVSEPESAAAVVVVAAVVSDALLSSLLPQAATISRPAASSAPPSEPSSRTHLVYSPCGGLFAVASTGDPWPCGQVSISGPERTGPSNVSRRDRLSGLDRPAARLERRQIGRMDGDELAQRAHARHDAEGMKKVRMISITPRNNGRSGR
ncbi:MAG: hypothetical protein R2705_16355 [Ilumatobacteraceae bacterium]